MSKGMFRMRLCSRIRSLQLPRGRSDTPIAEALRRALGMRLPLLWRCHKMPPPPLSKANHVWPNPIHVYLEVNATNQCAHSG